MSSISSRIEVLLRKIRSTAKKINVSDSRGNKLEIMQRSLMTLLATTKQSAAPNSDARLQIRILSLEKRYDSIHKSSMKTRMSRASAPKKMVSRRTSRRALESKKPKPRPKSKLVKFAAAFKAAELVKK
jgi:hypothetical protein